MRVCTAGFGGGTTAGGTVGVVVDGGVSAGVV
jgi:hypothetical protein